MPQELILVTILVSFFAAVFQTLGGMILLAFIVRYTEYIRLKYEDTVSPAVLTRGYIVVGMAFTSGIFFIFRIFYLVNFDKDFSGSDWLLHDALLGAFVYMVTHFLIALQRETHRIEKDSTNPKSNVFLFPDID